MRSVLKFLFGVALCAGTSTFLCLYLRDSGNLRYAVPIICFEAVTLTALFAGPLAGLIGSVVGNLLIALLLFPPFGGLWIRDPKEQFTVTAVQILALVVVVLSPRYSGQKSNFIKRILRSGIQF